MKASKLIELIQAAQKLANNPDIDVKVWTEHDDAPYVRNRCFKDIEVTDISYHIGFNKRQPELLVLPIEDEKT